MDACANPAPLPDPRADDDPAEEDAFYRVTMKRVTIIAAQVVEDVQATGQLTLDKKAGAIGRLGRLITSNGLAARKLREPPRTPPSPRSTAAPRTTTAPSPSASPNPAPAAAPPRPSTTAPFPS